MLYLSHGLPDVHVRPLSGRNNKARSYRLCLQLPEGLHFMISVYGERQLVATVIRRNIHQGYCASYTILADIIEG